ncbi:MAG TPA: histidine phosphatase family protein [Chthonomonadaceae bacterium]|nr:histidine phosphatase family protein [Chthonomonadaceae bacterium]
MKIYIIRHGQSTHNANQDNPHNPDPPLTTLGREQAQRTAVALRETGLGAVALYASPQRRALETAAFLQQALQLSPHILPDLCEAGGLGEHAGLCRNEILREWPGVTLEERVTEQGWWTGGESDREEAVFYPRAEQALALLRARHGENEDTIILVTHGRFGSALLSTILGLGPAGYSRYPFDNCGISRADYDPHEQVGYAPPPISSGSEETRIAVRLRFHNQVEHLPLSLRT